MMIKKLIPGLFFFWCLSAQTIACSCIEVLTFCETITDRDGNLYPYQSIIRAKVTNKSSAGIDISVEAFLGGINLDVNSLFIRNGYGADCSMGTDRFEKGSTYILSILEDQNETSHWISICGKTVLEVNGSTVVGPIAPGMESMSYEDFILTPGCALSPGPLSAKEINLAPNLVRNGTFIHYQTDTDEISIADWQLYDASGRLQYSVNSVELSPGLNPIDLSRFQSGLYYLKLNALDQSQVFKIVKTAN